MDEGPFKGLQESTIFFLFIEFMDYEFENYEKNSKTGLGHNIFSCCLKIERHSSFCQLFV